MKCTQKKHNIALKDHSKKTQYCNERYDKMKIKIYHFSVENTSDFGATGNFCGTGKSFKFALQ